jgi:hypothetical protein
MVATPTNSQTSAAGAIPTWQCGIGGVPVAAGFQQISAATLASAQTLTVPAGANLAVISVEGTAGTGNGVRWRDDGTAPTSTVGILIPPGNTLVYSAAINAIQFIEAGGSSLINVSYYQ